MQKQDHEVNQPGILSHKNASHSKRSQRHNHFWDMKFRKKIMTWARQNLKQKYLFLTMIILM